VLRFGRFGSPRDQFKSIFFELNFRVDVWQDS
jgi:hypothetical protein